MWDFSTEMREGVNALLRENKLWTDYCQAAKMRSGTEQALGRRPIRPGAVVW